jgi:hypothetical protein
LCAPPALHHGGGADGGVGGPGGGANWRPACVAGPLQARPRGVRERAPAAAAPLRCLPLHFPAAAHDCGDEQLRRERPRRGQGDGGHGHVPGAHDARLPSASREVPRAVAGVVEVARRHHSTFPSPAADTSARPVAESEGELRVARSIVMRVLALL